MARRITAVAVLVLSLPLLAAAAEPSGFAEVRGADGFWRVGRDDAGAWWFISPNGKPEFLNNVTTVQPRLLGRDRNGPHYLAKDFDGDDLHHWADAAVRRVADLGFKGVGAWSEPVLHQFDVPMTRDLNVSAWFGGDPRRVSLAEWEAQVEVVIRDQVEPLRNNQNLVGYYIDNELSWGGDSAETYRLARRYFEVTTRLMRKHDPNHLILGVRFRGEAPRQVVRASVGLTDAQSINYYPGDARPDRELFESLHNLSGGQPVIVSEYSFHALDGSSGNRNRFGFPAQVADQKARAESYRQMTTRLARLPYVIGADWFQWMDEPPSGRIRDGEDVNFGVVDVKDEAYDLLVNAVRSTTPLLNPLHARSTADSYADVWRESTEKIADVGTGELVTP